VKGFAVTLTIGLLASMFTAVFVSRQLFELVLRARANTDSLSI
jgi:preprotein translocase subunit SecD